MKVPHQDAVAGLVLIAFCALAFGITTTLPEVPATLSQNLPPTFFPRLVLAAIFVLSGALIVSGFRKRREEKREVAGAIWVTAGLISLSVALIEPLGMMTTIIFLMVALPYTWGEGRLIRVGWLAAGVPLMIYLIFSVALGVEFPAGYLVTFFFSRP